MKSRALLIAALLIAALLLPASSPCPAADQPAGKAAKPGATRPDAAKPATVTLADDAAAGQLAVRIGGREALVYVYGSHHDMPHYYPLRSPSGKSMLVQQTEPYPHHRAFWFADKVQLEGQRVVEFYSALYTRIDKNDPQSPCKDRIRHVRFTQLESSDDRASIDSQLVWEMDQGKTPVLDEARSVRLVSLGGGEYFADLTFVLTATYGDVKFLSDAVHYAWPFIRINTVFNVSDGGGTITSSTGAVNQAGTNMKEARWIDYSCTVEDVPEGLAMFSHPDNAHPHKWLTRDYGTFGPRRSDEQSGQPFTLKKGDSLSQRVGVLVHGGDVQGGRVAERYSRYVQGSL